jgi:transposase
MRTGRPIPPLTLTDAERETLERWARRAKTAQAVAQRARLILGCAAGRRNTVVAHELRLIKQTVSKWRSRFLARRLDGLLDDPRPGAPRTITDAQVERVLTRTLESTPADATHWSTRSMAQASGLSRSAVHRIWRAFALQPHRTETFKLSTDPLFIEKVRDIVGLYLQPPDRALVLCVDEKSQIQALDRTQPLLPMRPGQVERRTAPPRCSPHSTRRQAQSLASCIGDIAASSSASSSTRSTLRCRLTWTCISSSTTTAPTRPP